MCSRTGMFKGGDHIYVHKYFVSKFATFFQKVFCDRLVLVSSAFSGHNVLKDKLNYHICIKASLHVEQYASTQQNSSPNFEKPKFAFSKNNELTISS